MVYTQKHLRPDSKSVGKNLSRMTLYEYDISEGNILINIWYTYTVLLCIILGFWLLWAHFFFCTSCTLHPVILHITYLYPCSTKLKAGYTGIRLSICLYGRPLTQPRSPGCNSSTIMLKLDRDVPWVKISAEFVHGRRSMFKWGLNDLINYFDLISLLPLFRVQFFYDRG